MSAANTTLNAAIAAGFDQPSTRDLMLIAAYGASGGGGGGGSVTFGNYAGGQPNFTPTSGTGMAVDTSNNSIWVYTNGAWH